MKVVTVPFLNPTENVARIVAVFVTQGDQISKGSVLFELETAKATTEVVSPSDGYVVGLDVAVGDSRKFGDRLMWVADSADEDPPISDRPEYSESAPALLKRKKRLLWPMVESPL
jgi:pyruvate/2-oxoglutarate dehydrogenase complex dihydrolipoamide acyltransferase (E2) component